MLRQNGLMQSRHRHRLRLPRSSNHRHPRQEGPTGILPTRQHFRRAESKLRRALSVIEAQPRQIDDPVPSGGATDIADAAAMNVLLHQPRGTLAQAGQLPIRRASPKQQRRLGRKTSLISELVRLIGSSPLCRSCIPCLDRDAVRISNTA